MMDFIIKVLLYMASMIIGGAFIGGCLENYKNGKYGGCGLNAMFALTMIKLMFAI